MTTYIALAHARRLSLRLVPRSFLLGFEPLSGASLSALRLQARFPGGPHCGRESSTVLGSLQGSTHVSHVFLCWRPCRSRSPIPSLAPWWSPCPLLRRALLSLSCYVLSVPSAFSLHRSRSHCRPSRVVSSLLVTSFVRGRFCGWGVSPCLGSIGAQGIRGGSTYIALHRTWSVSAVLTYATWGSGRWLILLPARLSACIHGDCFISLTVLCMSQPKMSCGVVLFGHMPC